MNLLLIRKDVPQIQYIINSLTTNTSYIILNEYETIDTIINKINNKCNNQNIENIGFITVNDYNEYFYFSKLQKSILYNCDLYDPDLISWNHICALFNYLKNTFKCASFDFLTCNVFNNKHWNFIIQSIYSLTNIQIRSSINITGTAGDWILESHNINLINLYFTNHIKQYPNNLDTNYELNFMSKNNLLFSTGSDENGIIGYQSNIFKQFNSPNNNIKDFATGYNYSILLTNDNKIYGYGLNDGGQLGDGTFIDKYFYTEMNLTPLDNSTIKQILSSGYTSYIFTEDNQIFTCGTNVYGEAGIGNDYPQNVLQKINNSILNNSIIEKIDTGIGFFVLLANNKLYSCGLNNYKQLGVQLNNYFVDELKEMNLINFNQNTYPIDFKCGGYFNIVLANDYQLYACGLNNFGQLSTKNTTNQPILYKMNLDNLNNSIPIQLACGELHTTILTDSNELYVCGYNAYGQLGNNSNTNLNVLTKSNLNNILPSKISCGNNHTIIYTSNNQLYSTGYNFNGQLGLGNNNNYKMFTQVNVDNIDISNNSRIIAGYNTSFILSNSLYGCGYNKYNNLNYSNFNNFSNTNLYNSIESTISIIKYGKKFLVILTNDNKLYTCGKNTYGQLGIGTVVDSNILQHLNEITITISPSVYPIDIACGDEHFLVLMNNNKVYGCGRNNYGQLAKSPNQNNYFTSLSLIDTSHNITKIACGSYHSVFLTDTQKVLSCGLNNYGQLGNQSISNSSTLVDCLLTNLDKEKPTFISCGAYHTTIITNQFNLFSCGLNNYGQLGHNTLIDVDIFTKMIYNNNDFKPIFITCGTYHTIVLTTQGKVYSCGYNANGQLCNKTYNNLNMLTEIIYPTTNKIISIYAINNNSFIVDELNQLYSCGLNDNNQLGLDLSPNYSSKAIKMNNNEIEPNNIYTGSYNSYILTNNGLLYGCGKNSFNQLNNDDFFLSDSDILIPFDMTNLNNINYIAVGDENIFIINNDQLYVCGKNTYGQFGDNNVGNYITPTKVNFTPFNTNKPSKVFTSGKFTFVLTKNNILYATGRNNYGQLGNNSTNNTTLFTLINSSFIGASTIKQISCGMNHSVLLTHDNKLFVTGSNKYGQLGTGNNNNLQQFTQLNLQNINGLPTQVVCGSNHTLILTDSNKVYGCGYNGYGQLGNNTTANSNIFIEMNTGVIIPKEIMCGDNFSLVLTTNNLIYGCGRNSEGQIMISNSKLYTQLQNISINLLDGEYTSKLYCGVSHTMILTNFNNVYTFGNNDYGQLNLYKEKNINELILSKITNDNLIVDFLENYKNTITNSLYSFLNIQNVINKYNLTLNYIFNLVSINNLYNAGYSLQQLRLDGVTITIFINNNFTLRQLYEAGFTFIEIYNTNKFSYFDLLIQFNDDELNGYQLISFSNDLLTTEPYDYYIFIDNNKPDIRNDVILINRKIPRISTPIISVPFLSIKAYNESLNIDTSSFTSIQTKPINVKLIDLKNIFYYPYRIYSLGNRILSLIIFKYMNYIIYSKFIDEYESKYNNLFQSLSFDKQISFYKELTNISYFSKKRQILNESQLNNTLQYMTPINDKYFLSSEIIFYSQVLEVGFKLTTEFIIYK